MEIRKYSIQDHKFYNKNELSQDEYNALFTDASNGEIKIATISSDSSESIEPVENSFKKFAKGSTELCSIIEQFDQEKIKIAYKPADVEKAQEIKLEPVKLDITDLGLNEKGMTL